MVRTFYIPNRGDIVWLNFSPSRGHEQKGKRPALILSLKDYNERSGLAIVCPITSKKKGYPFEVEFSARRINGIILADQLVSIDWKERAATLVDRVPAEVITEVQEKASLLINDAY